MKSPDSLLCPIEWVKAILSLVDKLILYAGIYVIVSGVNTNGFCSSVILIFRSYRRSISFSLLLE